MKPPLLTNIWHEVQEIVDKKPVSRINVDFYNPHQAKIYFEDNLVTPDPSTLIFSLPNVRLNMPPLTLKPLDGIINDLQIVEKTKEIKKTQKVRGIINLEHPIKYHLQEEKNLLHRITLEFDRSILGEFLKDKKILLDPGHGGDDKGNISPVGLVEKEIVLDFSLRLKKYLDYWQAKVFLTRETDFNPMFKNRLNLIKKTEPDLIISLHTRKGPAGEVLGPRAKYSKDSQKEGEKAAACIYKPYSDRLPFPKPGVTKSSKKILSVLPKKSFFLEISNISNRLEEGWLRDHGFVEDMAKGLVVGIKNYFSKKSQGF